MEHLFYQVFWSSFKKIGYSQHTASEVAVTAHCTWNYITLSTSKHQLWNNQTLPYFCMKNKTGILTGKRWNKKLICTLATHLHASVWVIQVPCNSALWKSNICILATYKLVLHFSINVCLHISFQTPILYLLFVWWLS